MTWNDLLGVVARLVPATSIVKALSQTIGVAGTSPATTRRYEGNVFYTLESGQDSCQVSQRNPSCTYSSLTVFSSFSSRDGWRPVLPRGRSGGYCRQRRGCDAFRGDHSDKEPC